MLLELESLIQEMHCEKCTADVDEQFCNALALLRSTDEGSTEKLRRMLDTCIEKRYGPGKTLAARMPKRFLRDADDSILAPLSASKRRGVDTRGQAATKNEIWNGSQEIISLSRTDDIADRSTMLDVEVYEVGYVNCDEDIPRISIPDEGSIDTIVCKICNGAKLGPLILLECQECQETYHPLCHQPPVVDANVYDPRFVWRCRRCVETSTAISVKREIVRKEVEGNVGRNDDTTRWNKNVSGLRMHGRKVDLGKNDSPIENRSTKLQDSPLLAETLTNSSPRNESLLSATTRKRIGSKLIVTRALSK